MDARTITPEAQASGAYLVIRIGLDGDFSDNYVLASGPSDEPGFGRRGYYGRLQDDGAILVLGYSDLSLWGRAPESRISVGDVIVGPMAVAS